MGSPLTFNHPAHLKVERALKIVGELPNGKKKKKKSKSKSSKASQPCAQSGPSVPTVALSDTVRAHDGPSAPVPGAVANHGVACSSDSMDPGTDPSEGIRPAAETAWHMVARNEHVAAVLTEEASQVASTAVAPGLRPLGHVPGQVTSPDPDLQGSSEDELETSLCALHPRFFLSLPPCTCKHKHSYRRIADLAIQPRHLFGLGLQDLSASQLFALEEIHRAALANVSEAMHHLVARERASLADDLRATKADVELLSGLCVALLYQVTQSRVICTCVFAYVIRAVLTISVEGWRSSWPRKENFFMVEVILALRHLRSRVPLFYWAIRW